MGFTLTDNNSEEALTYSHVKRVAILGAGVAGLQTAHQLQQVDGITDVTIFERADDVAGVPRGGKQASLEVRRLGRVLRISPQ